MSWIPIENSYFLNFSTLEIAFAKKPINIIESLKESTDIKAIENILRLLIRLTSNPPLWIDVMIKI